MKIHQIIQGFAPHDGTSNLTLKIRAMLREAGVKDSEVFSAPENIAADSNGQCLDIAGLRVQADDVLIYHFGNASRLTDYFLSSPARKVLVYHNFTPPEFFRIVAPERAESLARSQSELERMTGKTDMVWAISNYNMQTLKELGFENLRLFPEWMDTRALDRTAAKLVVPENETRLLFVGRVAPNKNIEDLLRTFYYFKHTSSAPAKRLVIAGSDAGMERYTGRLKAMIRDFDITREVTFTGPVSQAELNAWYKNSHAFLCTSRHEGFCIPLLEAAYFNLPVFAFDIPAVRETLNGSGVLIKEKNFKAAALLIDKILETRELKADIIKRQKERLKDFDRAIVSQRLKNLISELTNNL